MLLDALPGESHYKTAVANSIGAAKLAEMAKRPREGFPQMSRTDLVLYEIFDRLGVIAYALRAYERVPDPYPRPGVLPKGRRDPHALARLRAIAQEHADLHGYTLDDPSDVTPD